MDQQCQVMEETEALACWTQSKAGGGTRRLAENKKPDVFHVGSRARAKFTAGS
jgi:hypothetical protein